MDVRPFSTCTRVACWLLALAVISPAVYGDDPQPQEPSTLVVTASDAGGELQQPASVSGNELIVRAADGEFAMATDGEPAAASNFQDAAVVANASTRPALTIIADEEVVPAAARRRTANALRNRESSGWLGQGPRRPNMASGIQEGGRGSRFDAAAAAPALPQRQPATMTAPQQNSLAPQQRPQNTSARPASPPAVAVAASPSTPTELAGSASDLLIQAYELSLKAATETEYSRIIRACADAMRQTLSAENRQFCEQLSAWALNRRGQIRAEQGQDALALADFRAAIEFDANCWRAIHNRGVTFAQTGKFAEAFDDISHVIELNPQHSKAYSNRATLYVQAGDLQRAMADYQAALKIDPQLTPALVGYARLCHMQGRLDEALRCFDAAIAGEGVGAEVICSRADLLVDLGRYADALQDYARAIDLDPKFEHAYRNGAWLLATCPEDDVRDAEGALTGAQSALDCGYGERHAALDTLAAALANAGRFAEAIAAVQQAIEVAPEEARPAYQARLQLYESGQPYRTEAAEPLQPEVQTADYVEVDG
ncbi:MAG: tetratricopeptide repeat protein [Pirellulales bacterium]|nr:tetratricopeptide repeat protein [Pirellulales bacterium]